MNDYRDNNRPSGGEKLVEGRSTSSSQSTEWGEPSQKPALGGAGDLVHLGADLWVRGACIEAIHGGEPSGAEMMKLAVYPWDDIQVVGVLVLQSGQLLPYYIETERLLAELAQLSYRRRPHGVAE